jgi:hypothetical protein
MQTAVEEKQWVLRNLSVLVALVNQQAMRMRHSHLWPAQLNSIFPYSHKRHDFRGKEKYWTQNVYFEFFSHSKKN